MKIFIDNSYFFFIIFSLNFENELLNLFLVNVFVDFDFFCIIVYGKGIL